MMHCFIGIAATHGWLQDIYYSPHHTTVTVSFVDSEQILSIFNVLPANWS